MPPPRRSQDNLSRRSFLAAAGRVTLLGAGLPPVLNIDLLMWRRVTTAPLEHGAEPALPAAVQKPVYHGARTISQIALTIDDGWSPTNVRKIFDILQAHDVPATFFPYARAMHLDPGLWRRISEAGYPIANHTNSHPFMTRLTPRKQHYELTNARSVTEQITGRRQLRVFRPPYGEFNATTLKVAHDAGFPTTLMWDVDPDDASRTHGRSLVIRSAEKALNGSVVVLHGGPALTPTILPSIIAFYRRKGLEFVTVPELLGEPDPG